MQQCPPCISSIRIHWSTRNKLVFDMTSTKATAPFMEVHAWRSMATLLGNTLQITAYWSILFSLPDMQGIISTFFYTCKNVQKTSAAFLYINMCDFASCEFQLVSNCRMYFPKCQFKKKKNTKMVLCVSSMFV